MKVTREFVLDELAKRYLSHSCGGIAEDEITSDIFVERQRNTRNAISKESARMFLENLVKNGTMSKRRATYEGHFCVAYKFIETNEIKGKV